MPTGKRMNRRGLKTPRFKKSTKSKGRAVEVKARRARQITRPPKRGMRLKLSGGRGTYSAQKPAEWDKVYRKLLKKEHLEYPTPEGITRREWQKLHRLPRPFKVRGGPAYKSLSRRWWDGLSRERQIEFHQQYPESYLRKLFPVNSSRHQRLKKDVSKNAKPKLKSKTKNNSDRMKSRKSPAESATQFKPGTSREGLNGAIWEVKVTSSGVHRWVQVRQK